MKCLSGSDGICQNYRENHPDTIFIYRTLHTTKGMRDCPTTDEWHNPEQWVDSILPYLPVGYDYYEIINECGPPAGDYRIYATFAIKTAQILNAKGYMVLAFSFAPGNPNIGDWKELYRYIQWAQEHPVDGKYNGIAFHAAAFSTYPVADDSWINNPWIAGRMWLVRDYLLETFGFDLWEFKGPIVGTEVGVTDGYSGKWEDFPCAFKADAYKTTAKKYAEAGMWLLWWNFGKISKWTSDHLCLPQMTS